MKQTVQFVIELYITGNSSRSELAQKSVREICDKKIPDGYKLEVYDVLEVPEVAEKEKIMATPTLIRRLPPPVRRLVGDLSDKDKISYYLDLK